MYDGAFSYWYWVGAGWSRSVNSPILCDALSARKQHKQGDSMGEGWSSLRYLSQFSIQRKGVDQLPWVRVQCIPFCRRMDWNL